MNIVLVRFNQKELEEACIESIKKYTDLSKHTLTVVDNYEKRENLSVVWNRLIKNSTDNIICLLNTDTLVEKDWHKITEALGAETVGIVGPITDNCHTSQKNMERKDLIQEVDDLSGFCYLFRKEVWEEVGGFDEECPFYGQDSLFNLAVQEKGYRLVVDRRVFIHHVGSASYDKARDNGDIKDDERKKGADYYWSKIKV